MAEANTAEGVRMRPKVTWTRRKERELESVCRRERERERASQGEREREREVGREAKMEGWRLREKI